jgi:hypothetical protein
MGIGFIITTMLCRRHIVTGAAVLLTAGAVANICAADDKASGQVYKWVDAQGMVHYGDSVPAEYSQNERSLLNSHGVEVGHVASGKSPEQQAEEEQAEQLAKQREQHDQFLLSTYVSVKDIEQLRDERLEQIDSQIKASAGYIDTLNTRLAALQDRVLHFKPYSGEPTARRLPDDLAEQLVRTMNEMRTQREALEVERKKLGEVRVQFEADIARYHELKNRSHS